MKKIILLLTFLLLSANLFSKGFYDGNIQFSYGFNINENQVITNSNSDQLLSQTSSFDMQTIHQFSPSNFIKFGFMAGFNIGFGNVFDSTLCSYENAENNFVMNGFLCIGPSLGLNLLNILKFNITPAYVLFGEVLLYDTFASFMLSSGFGIDVNIIALPKLVCSPILGYKFIVSFAESYINDPIAITTFKNELYLGISFNW